MVLKAPPGEEPAVPPAGGMRVCVQVKFTPLSFHKPSSWPLTPDRGLTVEEHGKQTGHLVLWFPNVQNER